MIKFKSFYYEKETDIKFDKDILSSLPCGLHRCSLDIASDAMEGFLI